MPHPMNITGEIAYENALEEMQRRGGIIRIQDNELRSTLQLKAFYEKQGWPIQEPVDNSKAFAEPNVLAYEDKEVHAIGVVHQKIMELDEAQILEQINHRGGSIPAGVYPTKEQLANYLMQIAGYETEEDAAKGNIETNPEATTEKIAPGLSEDSSSAPVEPDPTVKTGKAAKA